MPDVARLLLVLSGESIGAVTAIGEAEGSLGGLSKAADASSANLAGALLKAGAAVVAVGALVATVSTKFAADFQQGTTRLITNAGETREAVDGIIAPALLRLAVTTGYSTGQLIEGFRMVSSAGFKAAEGVQVLTVAAEGARSEQADMGTVLDVVTSLLNAYSLKASDAGTVMNTLIAAMQSGKLTLQDLAANLGTVIPAAAQAHVSIQELTSALAVMANEGVKPANAATYLRFTLLNLENPTTKARKELQAIGLDAEALSQTLTTKGLAAAIALLEEHITAKFPSSAAAFRAEMAKVKAGTEDMDTAMDHLSKETSPQATAALMNIVGGIRGAQGVLALGGQHLKGFELNTAAVTDKVKKAGIEIIGWNEIQGNFNFQMSRSREAMEVGAITIGTKLLPLLTPLLKAFADGAPLIQSFADRVGHVFEMVAGVAAGRSNIAQGSFGILYEAFGVDPKTAAVFSDTLQRLFDNIGTAAHNLLPVVRELGKEFLDALPTILQIAEGLANILGPALVFVSQHGDQLRPILIALAVGFGLIKAVELGHAVATWVGAFREAVLVAGRLNAVMSAMGLSRTFVEAVGAVRTFATETLLAQGRMVAGWVATQIKTAASFVATTAVAGANAAATAASWVASAATTAAGWVATQLKTVASFVAVAASSVAQAAIVTARWLIAQGAMLAVRAATLLWAAAQWILNVALSANPIGLVIIAIAALVGGVIWAYQNVGWFRDAVNRVWDALRGFVSWIWSHLMGALNAIASKAREVGGALNSINPFAQHSPSLVQNVEEGTKVITARYGRMAEMIRSQTAGVLAGTGAGSLPHAGSGLTDDRIVERLDMLIAILGGPKAATHFPVAAYGRTRA